MKAEFTAWNSLDYAELIRQIRRELKIAKHCCAIYEEELSRFWPDDGKQRELMIAQFAQDNGFRLRFILTVYAQSSMKSLANGAKSKC